MLAVRGGAAGLLAPLMMANRGRGVQRVDAGKRAEARTLGLELHDGLWPGTLGGDPSSLGPMASGRLPSEVAATATWSWPLELDAP